MTGKLPFCNIGIYTIAMTTRFYLLLQGKHMAYQGFHKLSCSASEEIVHFMNTLHRNDNVVEMLTPTHQNKH